MILPDYVILHLACLTARRVVLKVGSLQQQPPGAVRNTDSQPHPDCRNQTLGGGSAVWVFMNFPGDCAVLMFEKLEEPRHGSSITSLSPPAVTAQP